MKVFSEGILHQNFFDDTVGIHKKTDLRMFMLRITYH